MSNEIAARVVKRGRKRVIIDEAEPKQEATAQVNKVWPSLPQSIAESGYYEKNKFIPLLKERFKFKPDMWTVEYYFPFSKHGEIYVESYHYPQERVQSEAKREVMREIGKRLIILGPKCNKGDAMQQLAEYECLGQPQSQN
jgi:hypothetical protein